MWVTVGGGTFTSRLLVDDFHMAHTDEPVILLTVRTSDLVEMHFMGNLQQVAEVSKLKKSL